MSRGAPACRRTVQLAAGAFGPDGLQASGPGESLCTHACPFCAPFGPTRRPARERGHHSHGPDCDTEAVDLAAAIAVDEAALAASCERHGIRRLALFGSTQRGELRADGDIDLLVEFAPGRTPGLLVEIVGEAAKQVGRDSRCVPGRSLDSRCPNARSPHPSLLRHPPDILWPTISDELPKLLGSLPFTESG